VALVGADSGSRARVEVSRIAASPESVWGRLVEVPMPTRVHIPEVLLRAVDRRARVLGISRDELIVKALERELQDDPGWSEGFFERLASPEAAVAEAAEEMLDRIRANRRSKKAIRL
jgi:hypothetical protein